MYVKLFRQFQHESVADLQHNLYTEDYNRYILELRIILPAVFG